MRMEADGVVLGALKGSLLNRDGDTRPDPAATRLLALAADQLALALRRDELRQEATGPRSPAERRAEERPARRGVARPPDAAREHPGRRRHPRRPGCVASSAEVRAAAEAHRGRGERLDRLVREVLDLSRIGGGALRPDLEALDLADAVEPVVERLRPALGARPVTFEPRRPAARPADAVLLDTVLTNLVENIARHTPARRRIAVTIDRPRGDRVELTIEDGGPGVPTDELEPMFDDFRRGPDAGERAAPRDGHRPGDRPRHDRGDGRDGVAPREPARRACGRRRPAGGARTAGRGRRCDRGAGARILLVEDDEPTRTSVAANLGGHGYRVAEAADVAEALRAWDADRPDLILLDLGLPDGDGST